MKKGSDDILNLVVGAGVVLLVAVIVVLIVNNKLRIIDKSLSKCPGVCANNCYVEGYSANPTGDAWCQSQTWSKNDAKAAGFTVNGDSVTGKKLGLYCCMKYDPKAADVGLKPSQSIGEVDDNGNPVVVETPPVGKFYFGENPSPSTSSNIYSNKEYIFKVVYDKNKNKIKKMYSGCTIKVVDSEGVNVLDKLTSISPEKCSIDKFKDDVNGKATLTVSINSPSSFEGSNYKLVVELTPNLNYIAPSPQIMSLRITSPIIVSGLANKYEKEKQIVVSCKDIDCISYRYYFTVDSCDVPFGNDYEMSITSDGKGLLNLPNNELTGGYFDAMNKIPYLCIDAYTRDMKIYTKRSDYPVKIDTIKPQVTGVFFPAQLMTEIVCDPLGGSPCTNRYYYHYVRDATSFIGALLTGAKNAGAWCPQSKSSYMISGENKIPHYTAEQVKVLCVMAEDEAGNQGYDILVTYNAYSALEELMRTSVK